MGSGMSAVALCFPPVGRSPRIDRVAREPFASEGRAVPAAEGDATSLSFVSVGRALPQHEVRIVDQRGENVADGVVGRLLFRGPSCMSAYYHNPDATARTLLPGGWLDSGDLAYARGGEVFITGRVKDLIIKGGRNLVPQEIEEVAASVDGIRKGCVAAFGIPDETSGTERLIVLAESHAESNEERDRLEHEVVAAVAAGVGVPPDVVRVVRPGVVPKTPSGKIRHAAVREAYAAGSISQRRRVPLSLRWGLLAGKVLGGLRAAAHTIGRGMQVALLVTAWALGLVLLGPLVLLLMYTLPRGRPVRSLSRVVCKIMLAISGCPVEIEGRDRMPRRGPLVLVSNHTSYADTPALLAALPVDFVFVAMKEILAWPLVRTLARRGQHPTVDRFHPQQSVADAAAVEPRLRAGEALLFFAEGGFSGVVGLRPFRLGAFRSAVACGAPVVPIALRGCRQILPDGARIPRPGRVHVWIGEPLTATGTGWRAVVDLRDRAAAAIALHCGEPRLEAGTGPARTTA